MNCTLFSCGWRDWVVHCSVGISKGKQKEYKRARELNKPEAEASAEAADEMQREIFML